MIIWLALCCHLDYISIEDCFCTEIILVFFSSFSLLIIRIEFFGSFLSGEWWMFSLFSFRFFSIAWSWLLSEILSASNLCYLYSGVVVTEATRGSVSGFFLFFGVAHWLPPQLLTIAIFSLLLVLHSFVDSFFLLI